MTKSTLCAYCLMIIFQCMATSKNAFADSLPASKIQPQQISITITGVQDSQNYSTDLTPGVKLSDSGATIEALLNKKSYNFEPITSEGEYLLEITAIDQSGKRAVRSVSFIIDKTAPETAADSLNQGYISAKNLFLTGSSSIALTAKDSGTVQSGVERTEYRIGKNSEWKAYLSPVTLDFLPSGSNLIFFRSIDRAGNIEPDKNISFYLDSTYPESTLEIGAPVYRDTDGITYATSSTAFNVSAIDSESGVAQTEYRIDSGPWTIYHEPFRVENEGKHNIQIRSIDRTGNTEPPLKKEIFVDSSPPITVMTPDERKNTSADIFYINSPMRFTLSATDRHSGVKLSQYRIGQGNWQTYAPFIIDDKKNQEISFRSIDNLANQEIIKSISIQIDKTPPVTKIEMPSHKPDSTKGILTVNDSTFFNISAIDSQSGVALTEYRVDNGEWSPYEPFTIQEGGQHAIYYRSRDITGNVESPGTISVLIDISPPSSVIRINNKPMETGETITSTSLVNLTISASDRDSGIKQIEYKLDDKPWTQYQPFSISDEGSHLVEFRGIDQLDNVESTKFVKVIIDRSPPVTTLKFGEKTTEVDGQIQITDKTVLALSASDQLSGAASSEYLITGRGERHGSEPFTIATSGDYEIRYWSTDRAGNRETDKISMVRVVVPPPPPLPVFTRPSPDKNLEGDGIKSSAALQQRPFDPDIPESIRIQADPTPPVAIKELPEEKINAPTSDPQISDEESVYLSGFITGKDAQSLKGHAGPSKDQTMEYFGIGGINAVIIALIFLIL